MKTSWRGSEDVFCLRLDLIETDIFALVVRLQKTSSRLRQDVIIKTNIFFLIIGLQDMFKMISKRLQGIFEMSCKTVFKISSRRFEDMSWRRLGEKENFYWEYLYLKNLNLYLTNLYLTNLYLTNQRRIPSPLLWVQ